MNILGISAFYHDSAACLIIDGQIIAAAQEERFTRIKHDSAFPQNAISFCLDYASLNSKDIDWVVFYDKPFLKFERIFETYLAFAPKGFKSFSNSFVVWVKDKLFQKNNIIKNLENVLGKSDDWRAKLVFSEHHLSHASSAFFASPFENAAILTMDGVGEWATTSLAIGKKNEIQIVKEINFPHSLGLLYSAFTYYLGFKVNSGEYKVMGLAPYGKPKYLELIKKNLIEVKPDGSFRLNMEYFEYCTGNTMTNKKFDRLFGSPKRKPETELNQRDMDIASSIQALTEEIILNLAKNIMLETKCENLCLAGGVALNCVANGKLAKKGIYKNLWIQPAAGDAGGSIGAALAFYYLGLKNKRSISHTQNDLMKGGFLGPDYSQDEIEKRLKVIGANYRTLSRSEMITYTAEALAGGKAIGWHQGRMEFGPRSLGSRSILADPRSAIMQKQLNLKIKFRESFRPFAPSILAEDLTDWFDMDCDSPYMLLVANVLKNKQIPPNENQENLFGIDKLNLIRSDIPAVTHVDYSARIQTVHKDTNLIYHELISKFKKITGCPILVNTSFNVRGEPIVMTPEDAFNCFMGTGIDLLVIGNSVLEKNEQSKSLLKDYKNLYELD
jgi:carbamoyltransferase